MDPATTNGEVRVCEATKYYCHRISNRTSDCINVHVLDCSLTFKVDKNISVVGLQVPTQITHAVNNTSTSIYTETLYAHILDSNYSRMTYSHLVTAVSCGRRVEICFNQPACIEKDKIYRLYVVFYKPGRYPIGECPKEASCEGVNFSFGVGRSIDSLRDGLIKSIAFKHQ